MQPPLHVARRLRRVAGWGAAATLLVVAIGLALERLWLGPTDQTALAHVAADVQQELADLTHSLATTARGAAADPRARGEAGPDVGRRRALFDITALRLNGARPGLDALSIYDGAGRAVAWAGRPSNLPVNRLTGAVALFVAPGSPGLSLIHVEPVIAASEANRRVGAVVSEAILTRGSGGGDQAAPFIFDTALVPLQLRAASFEGAPDAPTPFGFILSSPDGRPLLTAEVAPHALADLRATWRARTRGAALLVLAIALLLLALVFRDEEARELTTRRFGVWLAVIVALVLAARAVLAWAVPPGWHWRPPPPGLDHLWLRSAADWLATSLMALVLVSLLLDLVERVRLARHTRALTAERHPLLFWIWQWAAGALVGLVLVAHSSLLTGVVRASGTHGLTFGLYPLDLAPGPGRGTAVRERRRRLAGGRRAAPGGFVVARAPGRVRPPDCDGRGLRPGGTRSGGRARHRRARRTAGRPGAAAGAGRRRHRGGALDYATVPARVPGRATHRGYIALTLPTVAFYPALVATEQAALEHTIATEYAPEILNHRDELRARLARSREQLDAIPTLAETFTAPAIPGEPPDADRAFFLWSRTELGRQRLTSSVELYDPRGRLLSRFALNLPAEFLSTERPVDAKCKWDVFGEAVASTDDQVLLHAGRAVCLDDGTKVGAILVHVVLDYSTLPFVADQDPAAALARGGPPRDRATHGRQIAFAVYGWGRTPVYPTAGTAWPISTELLLNIYRADRRPLWEVLSRSDQRYRVLLNNERAGIYAIGYALPRPVDHAVTLAEVATLSGLTFIVLLGLIGGLSRMAGRQPVTGRELLREIRRSFYRKLFLLFVAASVVPVLALALVTRNYVAGQLREGLESGAVRTASAARRVIETVVSQQRRDRNDPVVTVTDEVMVSVSRIIDQDVNMFVHDALVATSQRDLFASGLLPTRIPAEVARAIGLERQSSYVGDERLGRLEYTVAAVPVRDGESGAILTVPLTLRQQEIEGEVAALDRRVTLAAVLFILLGAAIGYVTAERLGDPIQRLTRATGRIARGDLDARILVAPADELGRLVDAFNRMAEDLQRQRAELERTNRLAAWADMARQVAHDIKNPLTPIQLSAEFLKRVHVDSGAPLGSVVDSCIATILSQVTLLRQIASEFSSFASSPVARFAPTRIDEVIHEVLAPYRRACPVTCGFRWTWQRTCRNSRSTAACWPARW